MSESKPCWKKYVEKQRTDLCTICPLGAIKKWNANLSTMEVKNVNDSRAIAADAMAVKNAARMLLNSIRRPKRQNTTDSTNVPRLNASNEWNDARPTN